MLLQFSRDLPKHCAGWRILVLALAVIGAVALRAAPAGAQSDETNGDADTAESGTDEAGGDSSSASATDAGQSDGGDNQSGDPVADYFRGNTLFVFFHELGHGLIDKLQLPVLGREEDAVDQLATIILANQGEEDSVGGTPALTAALGWLDSWNKRESAPDDSDYWDEHSLDMQRYANIVCLVYGSNPEAYADMVKDWEMSEDRAERCPGEYESAQASWAAVTDGAWLPEDQKAPASNHSFTVEYKAAEHDEYREIADEFRQEKLLDQIVASLNESFILPSPIHIVTRECGEENAYYTPETGELTMCYEMLAMFMADAEKYGK